MAEENLPPQTRRIALYSAGGGFGGALLAIVIARILSGPCCCPQAVSAVDAAASDHLTATPSVVVQPVNNGHAAIADS